MDTGVIDWYLPRREFHHYLQRLVDAGLASRIMFGTDQMVWPQMIEVAVERDIFYHNAARFFRFSALASPR